MNHRFSGGSGQTLAADIFGPDVGPPILLIGGMGQTRNSWHRAAQRLAEGGRRAITLDIRGHGESDRAPDGDYSYPRQIEDIAAIGKAVGRPIVLAGNSLGGKISLAAAGALGAEVVSGLVMVDAVPRSRPQGVSDLAHAMRIPPDGFASLGDTAAQIALSRGAVIPPERLARNMRKDEQGRWHWHWDPSYRDPRHKIGLGAGSELLERLGAKVRVPTLLAWCEKSEIVDAQGVDALRAVIPQLEVESIPGATHRIVGEQNDIFADALLGFLDRHGL